jgi:hypothetical protein
MSSEDKIQFKVYIKKKTIDSFKQFLSQKWQTYGRGLLSLEVEQAIKLYISNDKASGTPENREHTRTIAPSEIEQLSHTMKGRKPKSIYTMEDLDRIRIGIKAADVYIDKKIKGLKIEANEKERVKAAMLKEDIAEWLVSSGKYEDREAIKQVPFSLLRQAISALKNITDRRSINNHIEYLKTYKQIDQTGLSGKQYRFLG